jgi:CRP-like cAMP-binding protein
MAAVSPGKSTASKVLEFVTANDWILIKAGSRHLRFASGDVLIRQGSPGGTMYVVRSGTASIEADGVVVARLGSGQICGEIAFLDSRPSSASVIADGDVDVDAIEWAELDRIFKMFPHLGARFYHSMAVLLSRRLRETSANLAQAQQNRLLANQR